jgi:hypothetical protein
VGHSRSGRGGEKKKSHHWSCRELNPGRAARSLVSVLTELRRLVEERSNWRTVIGGKTAGDKNVEG